MTHIDAVPVAIFDLVAAGGLTSEIRKLKAPIRIGDRLIYQEQTTKGGFTGKEIELEITYVQQKNPGLRPGFALVFFKKSINLNPDLSSVVQTEKESTDVTSD
jgi:hypothetical protein